jgi:hypothetical protein
MNYIKECPGSQIDNMVRVRTKQVKVHVYSM